MNRTRRAIGVGAFITLAVLGTAWALEHRSTGHKTDGGAASEVVAPASVAPNESDTSRAIELQHDRSDLLLIQG
jgi:hypothetical protein